MLGSILIDAREFNPHKLTGIGRVLSGLIAALAQSDFTTKIILAASNDEAIPVELSQLNNIENPRLIFAGTYIIIPPKNSLTRWNIVD